MAKFPNIPQVKFDVVERDWGALSASGNEFKFKVGELMEIAIDSKKKVLYEIAAAKGGQYLIVKLYAPEKNLRVLLSREPRDNPNPFLAVCTEEELEAWLKAPSSKVRTSKKK